MMVRTRAENDPPPLLLQFRYLNAHVDRFSSSKTMNALKQLRLVGPQHSTWNRIPTRLGPWEQGEEKNDYVEEAEGMWQP